MNAKRDGEFRQGAMSAAALDRDIASKYLARAEDMLAARRKVSVEENRSSVARTLRVSASTVRNIRYSRLNVVAGWLKENIISLFIDAAQAELVAIEHEIQIARQVGAGNSDGALNKIRDRAAAIVAILDEISAEGGPQ